MKHLFHSQIPSTLTNSVDVNEHQQHFGHHFPGIHEAESLLAHLPIPKHFHGGKILKRLGFTVMMLAVAFVLMNVALLFYPKDRAMPYASIGNLDIGKLSRQDIVKKLDDLSGGLSLTVETGERVSTFLLEDIGIKFLQ